MLPLGKVSPIKMRYERPPIMVSHRNRRVVKGHDGRFVVVGFALSSLLLLVPFDTW